ncbi:hypothetical protein [Actinoplanes sp. L3-i22]|uniref:hypothetical protein n=1 Tax=Actinoplanes sp. L3-i22 TaxID=2836373 RepID=UPI001C770EE1|nr:hypothetical protein [Actinoplanes sp. L3-i22]BCY08537.1 hypothetical protein L3i22_036250 [Actinoplanes sp. L3-i22]
MTAECPLSREYVGIIWIGDRPGIRFCILAASFGDAKALLAEEYGEGHVISMWNEKAASRPRE